MLALGALLASLTVTAYAVGVAVRAPAPELDRGDALLWDTALIAVIPMGLLWVYCLVGPAPILRVFAAGCGIVIAEAVWMLRAPRPGHDDHGPGGGGERPDRPTPPSGGEEIDWDALARTIEPTPRENEELVSV